MTDEHSSVSISTMRPYGSLIALVSGGYSVYQSTTGSAMTSSAWIVLGLGVIVVLHGGILLTPAVDRLGTASGPLVIGYAILMLPNQGLMTMTGPVSGGMDSGMGSSIDGGMAAEAMSIDGGMVAIAALMLASGVIMTVRRDMVSSESTATAREDLAN